MHATTDSSSSRIVTTSTRTPGSRRTSSRVVSMPESSPRCRSISTTSTEPGSIAKAPAASAAWATTVMPSSEPSRPAIPSRKTGWSSTIATRMPAGAASPSGTADHPQRQHGLDRRARTRRRVDDQPPTLLLGPLAHRPAADPGPGVAADAATGIRDEHGQLATGRGGAHRAPTGAAVPAHVDQGLADDAVGRGGHLRVQALVVLELEVHHQAVLGVAGGELLQRRAQAELVEHRREQAVREGAHVGHPLVELVLQGAEQLLGRRRVGVEQVARAAQTEPQPGERGAEPVVDLAPDDAPLGEP